MTETMEEFIARRRAELAELIRQHEQDITDMRQAPVDEFSIPDEDHKALVIARYERRLAAYRKQLAVMCQPYIPYSPSEQS